MQLQGGACAFCMVCTKICPSLHVTLQFACKLIVAAVLQKGALSTAEVCEALGLSQLKGRKWHVQRAVAIRGEGLYEGLDWYAFDLVELGVKALPMS